jgi:hypothetical protein
LVAAHGVTFVVSLGTTVNAGAPARDRHRQQRPERAEQAGSGGPQRRRKHQQTTGKQQLAAQALPLSCRTEHH